MSNCVPTSSNCIIWQGPNIECIGLCQGDTITDVIYKLATAYCELSNQLQADNFDISCIECPEGIDCTVDNIQDLLDVLIAKICELQTSVGTPGEPGIQGATGPQGPQGPAGADGADGVQGPQGATGVTGATGAQGATGLQGPIGPAGPRGADGADGADGAQGPQGEPGECDCCVFKAKITQYSTDPGTGITRYTVSTTGTTSPIPGPSGIQWELQSGPINNVSLVVDFPYADIVPNNPKASVALLKVTVKGSNDCEAYDTYLHVNLNNIIN